MWNVKAENIAAYAVKDTSKAQNTGRCKASRTARRLRSRSSAGVTSLAGLASRAGVMNSI
ncbi:hypothetical protein D3C78_1918230 [compost metagenome]